MLLGANPEQLNSTARKFGSASNQLSASRLNINTAVAAAWWAGPVAQRFQVDWAARLGPTLSLSAAMLDRLQRDLMEQRQQQLDASRADGFGGGRGVGGDRNFIPDPAEALLALADVAATVLRETRIVQVAAHMRAGKQIASYFRWAPGTADDMTRLFGSAADVAKFGKYVEKLGWAGVALNVFEQGYNDWGKYEADEFAGRVATRALIEGGVNYGSTLAAAAAAGAWGGPAGMAVGVLLVGGWYVFTHTEFGKDIINGIVDFGGNVGDFVGDVNDVLNDAEDWALDKAGDLLGGAGELAGDIAGALNPFD